MTTIQVLLIGNDTIIDVARLQDELTGEFVNDAEVSITLVDAAGMEVEGDTWPKPVPYVDDTDGLYRATLVYTLALVPDGRYTAQLDVDAGAGRRAAWSIACVARMRA
jgi:hypothetical protein